MIFVSPHMSLASIFFRSLHTVFHSDCTSLQSSQQFTMAPFSLHSPQHVTPCRFENSHYSSCEVESHCSFDLHFPDSDVEHLSICLLTICMSLEKCLFRSSAHFWIGVFCCCIVIVMSSWYILDVSPSSDIQLANIFSHSKVGYLFILIMVSFAAQKSCLGWCSPICLFLLLLGSLPLESDPQKYY